jgi:hypothetical protein
MGEEVARVGVIVGEGLQVLPRRWVPKRGLRLRGIGL